MNDREMLEFAAKAAGWFAQNWAWVEGEGFVYQLDGRRVVWNPLTDDGDALRLAVVLRITPHIDGNLTEAEWAERDRGGFIAEPHYNDPYAATRRAITRAAAEIGKAMK